jgi:hypothetical protein
MRHTSLNTTSRYMRTIPDRLKEAVKNLGQVLEAIQGVIPCKTAQKRILANQAANRLIARNGRENNGGRSRNRTYDLAHVRRALPVMRELRVLEEHEDRAISSLKNDARK